MPYTPQEDWEDLPSQATPISAAALNGIEQGIVDATDAIEDHIADGTAVHAASAIAFTPNGTIAATDVQAAIQEVRDEAGSGSVAASAVTVTPTGGIAATDAQAALAELDTEKANLAGPSFTGNPTVPNQTAGNSTTRAANTSFVTGAVADHAAVASSVHGITAAAATVLDDATVGDMRTTLGLGNVDNTADSAKPVSTAQQTALDLKQSLSGKDVVSGYAGLSDAQVITQNLQPPERRFSYPQRAASLFLARSPSSLIKELWITDSFGHAGSSTAQSTSCIAQYEAEMARAYNTIPRGVGFQPVELWNGITVDTDGAMAWDTLPAVGQHQARGSCLANKTMTSGQTASTTRDGTAVTIYYTERPSTSAGGVVTVSVNGYGATTIAAGSNGVNTSTFAGSGTLNVATNGTTGFPSAGTLTVANASTTAVVTYTGKTASTFTGCTEVSAGGVMSTSGAVNLAIDCRNGSLGAGVFNSGKSITIDNPSGIYGPMAVVLTHASLGTTFELEGAYFHAGNSTSGHMVMRADRSGMTLASWSTSTPLQQFITNQQPHIVTIMCGVNDEAGGASASTLAASLTTMISAIRACYSAWTPAIRYVFQVDSSYVGATWLTTYRAALRQACITNDALFIDMSDAVGSIDGSDPLDFSDDTLHPNDNGHRAIGLMVADVTTNASNTRTVPLNLSTANPQTVSATLGGLILRKVTNAPHVETMLDGATATANGSDLGFFGFRGTTDIYGTPTANTVAAVLGRSEVAFSTATNKAGLRFYITAPSTVSPIIGAGLTGDSVFFVGPTLGTANFSVNLAGTVTAVAYAGVPSTGAVTSSSASAGVGYATGAGSTVTQGSSKSTGVTLNNICGQITTHTETLNAGAEVSFTLTNSRIAATDVVLVTIASGATTNTYTVNVTATAAGSCRIQIGNVSGSSATEALVLNFAVIKSVAA